MLRACAFAMSSAFSETSKHQPGWLCLTCGPMFSGKTTAARTKIDCLCQDDTAIIVIRPMIDTREALWVHSEAPLLTPSRGTIVKCQVSMLSEAHGVVAAHGAHANVVVDEAQFFPSTDTQTIVNKWLCSGINVYMYGLVSDHAGNHFGPFGALLPLADEVHVLSAICFKCGNRARRTQRLADDGPLVQVGSKDMYQPICLMCATSK